MPELPEVETIRCGLEPYLVKQRVSGVIIRREKLRWPIPPALSTQLPGQKITEITRRGKYLLLHTKRGTVIIHLGMSGHLRMLPKDELIKKHDHVDFVLENGFRLRFNDPRRFGAVLWTTDNPLEHPLLCELGPEPLLPEFDGEYLYQRAKKSRIAIKKFIMNGCVVVGVGNIYANESLYIAGIHPLHPVNKISLSRYKKLANAIKKILYSAIESGGSTIRDFLNSDGKPGYFAQQLKVYGRGGLPCKKCKTLLQEVRISHRTTVFCLCCQPS
jgi:formamidopyrimidine-DNA glycosylase